MVSEILIGRIIYLHTLHYGVDLKIDLTACHNVHLNANLSVLPCLFLFTSRSVESFWHSRFSLNLGNTSVCNLSEKLTRRLHSFVKQKKKMLIFQQRCCFFTWQHSIEDGLSGNTFS